MSARRRSKTAVLREQAMLAAVLSQPTLTRAAAAVGVNEKTIRRAMKRPGFIKKVAEARKASLTAAVGSLSGLSSEAHDAIRRALTCGVPVVELRAGLAVLLDGPVRGGEFLFGMEELAELREQVAKLMEQKRKQGQQ